MRHFRVFYLYFASDKVSFHAVMLLKIYLSVLFFATVISKIEEKRFVLWGIVPQTENLSVVLDITMSKDSNAVLLCGTECNAQNNCSGMDICEEVGRCRIWEIGFVENFNSNDTAVKTCRRYMKVIIFIFLTKSVLLTQLNFKLLEQSIHCRFNTNHKGKPKFCSRIKPLLN